MTALTEDQRDALQAELRILDEAEAPIIKLLEPLRAVCRAIEDARDVTLERYGLIETVGNCVHCKRLIVPGDKGYEFDDEGPFCEDCSPSWADLLECFEAGEDEEARAAFKERMDAHVAGGSVEDKVTYVL